MAGQPLLSFSDCCSVKNTENGKRRLTANKSVRSFLRSWLRIIRDGSEGASFFHLSQFLLIRADD